MLLTVNNNSNIIIQASNHKIQQLSDHTHLRSDLNLPPDEKTLFLLTLHIKLITSLQTQVFEQPDFWYASHPYFAS